MIRDEVDQVGKLFEAGFESYKAMVETAVAVQEQNARLALDVFGRSAGMLAAQQEALMSLAGQPLGAYAGCATGEDLPVEDYDRLDVEELDQRLEGLCAQDVERLKAHERRTRNRPAVMERLDRSLV